MSESQNARLDIEERFLFDLNGFLVLRNVLSSEECAEYLETLGTLENQDYEDKWIEAVGPGRPTRETRTYPPDSAQRSASTAQYLRSTH